MQFIIRGSILTKMSRKKFRESQYELLHRPGKKPPKGSEIQPRSDGHRSTPVPLPSKQEEVKPNRHLGEMSAVNKVPEKQREDIRPKSHGGNSAYVPKSHEKPKNTQEDGNNGDVNMEDGTAEEEKEILNRTGPTTKATTPRNKSTGRRKGTTRRMTPTKETATRATRTRDPMNCRKSNSGDRNKALLQLYQR
jgi:hypothetical protein